MHVFFDRLRAHVISQFVTMLFTRYRFSLSTHRKLSKYIQERTPIARSFFKQYHQLSEDGHDQLLSILGYGSVVSKNASRHL